MWPRRLWWCVLALSASCGRIHFDELADAGFAPTEGVIVNGSNLDPNDRFGYTVALSADGTTLAVGASLEDSAATGIDGNAGDNSRTESGAAYVYVRDGSTWVQQAYIKAANPDAADYFGISVAVSADGSTLAVGATGEASATQTDPTDNSLAVSGAVYVFARTGTTWTQQAYLKAPTPRFDDELGQTVALSADGITLASGAFLEDTPSDSGAVHVFVRAGSTWSHQAQLVASNAEMAARIAKPARIPLTPPTTVRPALARSTCSRALAPRGPSRRT